MEAVEPLTAEDPADLARLGDYGEPDIDTVSTSDVERANLESGRGRASRAVRVSFVAAPPGWVMLTHDTAGGMAGSVAVTIDLPQHVIQQNR